MSRIKIEDLPVTENLTPEQEALIEGAGLRSFRPTVEGLEDRQLMDAGIGHALPAPMAPTAGGDDQPGHDRILGGQQQSADALPVQPAAVGDVSLRQFLSAPQMDTGLVASAASGAEARPRSDQSTADEYGRKVADAFIEMFAQRGYNNFWGITRASFLSAKPLQTMTYPTSYQVDIDLERFRHGSPGVYHSTLSLQFDFNMFAIDSQPNGVFVVQGSEVTTDGKPDASLFLLQGLLLSFRVGNKP
jgi:hypothetical protein